MADFGLQKLRRDVVQGLVAPEQLRIAECRAEGHKWKPLVGVPRDWLYVLLCEHCLATKGKLLEQTATPIVFTAESIHNNGKAVRHIIHYASYLTDFSGICGYKYRLSRYVHSDEMRLRVKQILETCHLPASCQECLQRRQYWQLKADFRDRGAEVYRDFFRTCAIAIAEGKLHLVPEGDL